MKMLQKNEILHGKLIYIIVLVLFLLAGVALTWWTIKHTDATMRNNLLHQTNLLAHTLDIELVKTLTGTAADLDKESYKKLKKQFAAIKEADRRCRFVYLMGRRDDGKLVILVDNEDPASLDYSPPGEVYAEATEGELDAYSFGRRYVEGPITDHWGSFVSSQVPIKDPETNAILAALGMDVDARTWNAEVIKSSLISAAMTIILMFMVLLVLLLRRSQYKIILEKSRTSESEERFRLLIDSIDTGTVLIDPHTHVIEQVNRHACLMFGADADEIVGQVCHNFLCPAEQHNCPATDCGQRIEQSERTMLDAEGRQKTVLKSVIRIFIDGHEKLLETFVDISEHKKLSEELTRVRALLQAAIEQSPAGILIADAPNGDIRLANAAARAIISDNDGLITEIPWDQCPHIMQMLRPDGSLLPLDEWPLRRAILKGETIINEELNIRRPDGLTRCVLNNCSPVLDNQGKVIASVLVFSDITERKKFEYSLQLNEKRLDALITLGQMTSSTQKELTDFTIEKAIELTGSSIGYLAFMNEDESILTMHSWSQEAMKDCRVTDKPIQYPVASTGLWGEAVRQRRAIITNDYSEPNPLKRGCPEGHVPIIRHMNIPVFDGGRIVAVAGVGNKKGHYDEGDLRQLSLLMDGMWAQIQRQSTAEELKKSEDRFRSIVNSSPMGMHMYELQEDNRLVFVGANPAGDAILGISNTPLIGLTIEEAFPSLVGTEIPERYRAAALNGESWQSEMVSYQDRHISGAFEVYAFQTAPRRMSVMFLEITAKKQAEEALLESEAKFRDMAEHMLDVLYTTDDSGIITYISPSSARLFGYNPSEMEGRIFIEFLPEDQIALAMAEFQKTLSCNQPLKQFGLQMKHRDGGVFSAELSSSIVQKGEKIIGTLGLIRDVTERRQAEEERAKLEVQLQQAMKMEAVGRLAGGVAHDFNNLLTSISGNVQLALLDLKPDEAVSGALKEIGRAAEIAASLTRQLLAFSRKQLIEPRVLNLNDILSSLNRMLIRLIGEDIELKTILGKDLCSTKVDPGQFEQIIVNLAVNARDAMPEGGTLLIETANRELDEEYCRSHSNARPGNYVMLAVSDTGCGISPETREHLFEPFFTTKEKGKGTGLGLATIYGAVKQAGGSIEVYSEVGQGTSFKIYLPCVSSAAQRLEKEIPSQAMPGGSETILLVEDEAMVRDLAIRILKRLGYKVLCAESGAKALEMAAEYKDAIDLLLTDVVMPGMNGRELAVRLREIHPESKVLFSSGYTENIIAHHGVIDEGLNFIGKPYTPRSLASKLRSVLEGRK